MASQNVRLNSFDQLPDVVGTLNKTPEIPVTVRVDALDALTKEIEDYNWIRPDHYRQHPAGIECKDVIGDMPCFVGMAMKHLWRIGLKPGETEVRDLEKAITYIQFELERLRKRSDSSPHS